MVSELTLNKISTILKDEGCREIFLFGSQANGHVHENSDIDIGIRGLEPSKFFSVYARLDNEIPQKIDFVDFDEQVSFFNFLSGIGELRKIG
ncbi:MAG: nucleotidyltransferase domain-containing protein [Treponema sp.]|nr:nucleotidyltransferase domain-containing protein [Treponema sp.]MBO6219388.1 nucleotidyltransferase domain-containing protein [Treponema sp.]